MVVSRLEQGIGLLSLFAKLAPMFGFIGTIIGVINIFYRISLTDNISVGDISEVLYSEDGHIGCWPHCRCHSLHRLLCREPLGGARGGEDRAGTGQEFLECT